MKRYLVAICCFAFMAVAAAQQLTPERQLAHDILKELVEIPSTSDVIGTEQIRMPTSPVPMRSTRT